MANIEIRVKLAETGVKQYEVAEYLKIAETSFSRKLRNELPTEEKTDPANHRRTQHKKRNRLTCGNRSDGKKAQTQATNQSRCINALYYIIAYRRQKVNKKRKEDFSVGLQLICYSKQKKIANRKTLCYS